MGRPREAHQLSRYAYPLVLGAVLGTVAIALSLLPTPHTELAPHTSDLPDGFGRVLDVCAGSDGGAIELALSYASTDDVRRALCRRSTRYAVVEPSRAVRLFADAELSRAENYAEVEKGIVAGSTGHLCSPREGFIDKSVSADFDGDGRRDRLDICPVGRSDYVFAHSRVVLQFATGKRVDHLAESLELSPVAATDVDGDGRPEVFASEPGNTAHTVVLLAMRNGIPIEVGGPFLYAATGLAGYGVNVGVECTDIDGDGKREIVETTQQQATSRSQDAPFDSKESWSFVAYRLVGSRVSVVKRAEGAALVSRPRNLRWTPGLVCNDVRYG